MREDEARGVELGDVLGHLRHRLSPSVVSAERFDSFSALAGLLKSIHPYALGFSCGLGSRDEPSLYLQMPCLTGAWHVLAGNHPFRLLAAPLASSGAWRSISHLAAALVPSRWAATRVVRHLELHFGPEAWAEEVPVPCLRVAMEANLCLPGNEDAVRKFYYPVVRSILGRLVGFFPPEVEIRIRDFLIGLAGRAGRFYLSVPAPGSSLPLMLSATGVSWSDLEDFLASRDSLRLAEMSRLWGDGGDRLPGKIYSLGSSLGGDAYSVSTMGLSFADGHFLARRERGSLLENMLVALDEGGLSTGKSAALAVAWEGRELIASRQGAGQDGEAGFERRVRELFVQRDGQGEAHARVVLEAILAESFSPFFEERILPDLFDCGVPDEA